MCSLCVDALQATPEPECGVCACPLHVVGPNPEIFSVPSESGSRRLTTPLARVARDLRSVEADFKSIDPVFVAGLGRLEEAHLGALALAKDTYDRAVRALEETHLGMLAEVSDRKSEFHRECEAARDCLIVTEHQMVACEKLSPPGAWWNKLCRYKFHGPSLPSRVDVRAGRLIVQLRPGPYDVFYCDSDKVRPSAHNVLSFQRISAMADLEAEDVHLTCMDEPLACEFTFTPEDMIVAFDAPHGASSTYRLSVLGVTVWEGSSDLDTPNLVLALKAAAVEGTEAFRKTLFDCFSPLHDPEALRSLVVQGLHACRQEDDWTVCHRPYFALMLEFSSAYFFSTLHDFLLCLEEFRTDGLPRLVRGDAVRIVEIYLPEHYGALLLQALMIACPDWTKWASSSMATAVKDMHTDRHQRHVKRAALRALASTTW